MLLVLALLGVMLIQNAQAFYNPSTGRWLSRDPIGEDSFELVQSNAQRPHNAESSLYRFGDNNLLSAFDYLGLTVGFPYPPPSEPPRPPSGSENCQNANPELSSSPGCARYGDRVYLAASLKCFCEKAPDDDWSKQVRGCLMCMDAKNVATDTAHSWCYMWADRNYSRPYLALANTWRKCRTSCLR